jgi:hypothetical protein
VEDNFKRDLKEIGCVDGRTGLGSWPVVGFVISGVEFSVSAMTMLLDSLMQTK